MSRPLLRASRVVLVIVLAGASVGWAAPRPKPQRSELRRAAVGLSLIERAWGAIRSIWANEGSSLDPDGKATQSPLPPRSSSAPLENGSSIDPFGGS